MVKNSWGVEVYFNAAVELMDDDIRERLHMELAPCSEQEFFTAYCNEHQRIFGEGFALDTRNPVY